MPGYFISPEGDLENLFIDDYNVIDQYAKTGSLWMWGINTSGRLGDNSTTSRSSPVQTVASGTNWKQISTGLDSCVAIKTDGTLWSWGENFTGQLGNGNTTDRSSPGQIGALTNWVSSDMGYGFAAAIDSSGQLWTWGNGFNGKLGNNSNTNASSPIQTVAAGNNWKQVSCGTSHMGAVKTDGTLWMWGRNIGGELGDNTVINKLSPVQTVAGGTNWKQVACGNYYTGAIKADGTLWMWGDNSYNSSGCLGDNTITNRSSPVQTVAGGTNWKSVSVSNQDAEGLLPSATAGIKTDGSLWLWGGNNDGGLGDNTTTRKSSPVQTVAGGNNWKQVTLSSYGSTAAIKTDGTLWVWGENFNGQLGNSSTISRSSPIQTSAGGTNWKQVSGGDMQFGAIHFYDAGNLYPNA